MYEKLLLDLIRINHNPVLKIMKAIKLIILFTVIFSLNGLAQGMFPVSYRIEKQSMSTPMTPVEDIFFGSSYYTKPVNVKFDGSLLNMHYDNGRTFVNKNVTKINNESYFEDDVLLMETFLYTDNENVSDTILFIVDYEVNYFQVVLTTKNSQGEKIGYTSYRKFVNEEDLTFKNEREITLKNETKEDDELALN